MEFHVGSLEDYTWRSHSEAMAKLINEQCGREDVLALPIPAVGHDSVRHRKQDPGHNHHQP